MDNASFVGVVQSFGNCPKYIQAREPLRWDEAPPALAQPLDAALDASALARIDAAEREQAARMRVERAPQRSARWADIGGIGFDMRFSQNAIERTSFVPQEFNRYKASITKLR